MKAFLTVILLLGLTILLGLTTTVLGYQTIISPKCTLHILDQNGNPIAGLHVIREWDDSGDQKGKDSATTDKDGMVIYEKVVIKRNAMKRVFKPLLIFVPAACGPNWETYSSTEITIAVNSPDGSYSLKPIPVGFKAGESAFSDKDGTHIICAHPVEYTQRHLGLEFGRNFITISFLNRKKNKDFDLTLNISNGITGQ